MYIDSKKMEDIINKLSASIYDYGVISCPASSVFIGEIDGRPIRLTVMTKDYAKEEHEYDGRKKQHRVC